MKYSPECVAAFEAKFGGAPEGCERLESGHYVANHYHCGFKALEHNARLEAFAANWERVREMQYVLGQIVSDLPSNKDWLDPAIERAARKLLEKGNE